MFFEFPYQVLYEVFIHRSAWKGYSPNSRYSVPYALGPTEPITPDNPAPRPSADPYMSWCRIKMRSLE